MDRTLTVDFTQDRNREPLAVVRNLPGLDAYMTPARMRALAHTLLAAAKECEAKPMGKKNFFLSSRTYTLVE